MTHHPCSHGNGIVISRRGFLAATAVLGGGLLLPGGMASAQEQVVRPMGPASKYVPKLRAAFVRRKGEYGMRWPGAVYDGEAARTRYQDDLAKAAQDLKISIETRPEPLYSLEEGQAWIAQAEADKVDGLLLMLLDRQEHAWPTAGYAVDSPLPAVIFSPIGTSFTINTAPLASKEGALICSTDDFGQVVSGIRMLKAGALLRETRFVVIKGTERSENRVEPFGTSLRYIPAQTFVDLYTATPVTGEIEAIAEEYMRAATGISGGATRADVCNGIKSYVVARQLLEAEEADGISMDCLGALGRIDASLPCIAWSRMLDCGVPAACEADHGACIAHALVQYLFARPGFQQDPVADTAADCLIGAHCTCPTKLAGFSEAPMPYHLAHHHGNRDAVPIPQWTPGQRMTVLDVELNKSDTAPATLLVSAGEVVNEVSVPPSGGCVVSVRVRIDGNPDMLSFPGFHQLFFYGDYKKELTAYGKLHRIPVQIA